MRKIENELEMRGNGVLSCTWSDKYYISLFNKKQISNNTPLFQTLTSFK